MVFEKRNDPGNNLRKMVFRASKAMIIGSVLYAVYAILWQRLGPMFMLLPGFQQMVEAFVVTYIVLLVGSLLTSGTIYQYFFNVAKALFVIGYVMFSLKTGVFELPLGGISVSVDLRLFLMVAMLLGLLGLAKTILQAIDFISARSESVVV